MYYHEWVSNKTSGKKVNQLSPQMISADIRILEIRTWNFSIEQTIAKMLNFTTHHCNDFLASYFGRLQQTRVANRTV